MPWAVALYKPAREIVHMILGEGVREEAEQEADKRDSVLHYFSMCTGEYDDAHTKMSPSS